MISFIVIGKNERWKLTKCLDSVYRAIQHNSFKSCEVIYIDSKSSDDSIERAKQNSITKVFQITGIINAAIARNIGVQESKGNILFFIDGDMEIESGFLSHVLNEKEELIYNCVTGHLNDLYYDTNDNFLCELPRTYNGTLPKSPQKLTAHGGIFIIKRECWEKVGGMRTKYRRSQDLDLTIRLNNVGIETIRIPFLITKHHTVDFRNEKRMWQSLLNGTELYPPLLFRNHILNHKVVIRILRNSYTAFLLLLLIISVFISKQFLIFSSIAYLLILVLRVIANSIKSTTQKNKLAYSFERLALQMCRDVSFWCGVLFFYPREKTISYMRIQ